MARVFNDKLKYLIVIIGSGILIVASILVIDKVYAEHYKTTFTKLISTQEFTLQVLMMKDCNITHPVELENTLSQHYEYLQKSKNGIDSALLSHLEKSAETSEFLKRTSQERLSNFPYEDIISSLSEGDYEKACNKIDGYLEINK